MSLFMDTFAVIAWLNPRDQAHKAVKQYLSTLRDQIVTTEWVFMEVADALCHPNYRQTTASYLEHLRTDPQYIVVPYNMIVYRGGLQLYTDRPDKEWSLTDCISFSVMKELGLTDALTADHHYTQAGFRAIFANNP